MWSAFSQPVLEGNDLVTAILAWEEWLGDVPVDALELAYAEAREVHEGDFPLKAIEMRDAYRRRVARQRRPTIPGGVDPSTLVRGPGDMTPEELHEAARELLDGLARETRERTGFTPMRLIRPSLPGSVTDACEVCPKCHAEYFGPRCNRCLARQQAAQTDVWA